MQLADEMQITLYTDGACDFHAPNQPGGWAAILRATDKSGKVIKETVRSGGCEMTTSNQMEITAVIEGLRILKQPTTVTIRTDSKYVIELATGKKRITKNKQLWKDLFLVAAKHEIEWRYIKAHVGHEFNERCDKLAVAERKKLAKNSAGLLTTKHAPNTSNKIYLSTSYSSTKQATAWAAVIVLGSVISEASDILRYTTEPEGVLIGAITALELIPASEPVTLYTIQTYMATGMNEWLPKWCNNNWITRSGKPVKYQVHWKRLLKMSQVRDIYVVYGNSRSNHSYFVRAKELATLLLRLTP